VLYPPSGTRPPLLSPIPPLIPLGVCRFPLSAPRGPFSSGSPHQKHIVPHWDPVCSSEPVSFRYFVGLLNPLFFAGPHTHNSVLYTSLLVPFPFSNHPHGARTPCGRTAPCSPFFRLSLFNFVISFFAPLLAPPYFPWVTFTFPDGIYRPFFLAFVPVFSSLSPLFPM